MVNSKSSSHWELASAWWDNIVGRQMSLAEEDNYILNSTSREANKPSSAALVGRSKTTIQGRLIAITHSVAGMLLTLGCCLNY